MSIPLISKYFFVLLYQIQFNMAICTYMGQAEETEYGIKGEKRGKEDIRQLVYAWTVSQLILKQLW